MNTDILSKKKKLLDKKQPLDKDLLNNLENWFKIELTYSSNAIEGNTLSRIETTLVIEKNMVVAGKSLNEHIEAKNHALALDWINEKAKKNKPITESDILHIHYMILNYIDNSNAGFYRRCKVRISGSPLVLPNPLKIFDLMKDFVKWLNKSKNINPAIKAAEAHLRLVSIHPFIDGNGRTARLLMNLILLMNGYPAAIIKKSNRLKYISSLEKIHTGGSKDDYYKIIEKAIENSLDIYLDAVDNKAPILEKKPKKLLKIGELAKVSKESISTIRYWTNLNLLEVDSQTESGYQLYNPNELKKIKKIKDLKKNRYTLQEIKKKLC